MAFRNGAGAPAGSVAITLRTPLPPRDQPMTSISDARMNGRVLA